MKKSIFLLFFFLFSIVSVAQDNVDFISFDLEKLSLYIFNDVNKVRSRLGLQELIKDDILVVTARFHADYILKINKLTHYQSKEKYKKPGDRVREFGGKHIVVSENVAFQQIQSNQYTYTQLSEMFVEQWLKSTGHYENIIAKQLNSAGLAVSFNRKTGDIFVVQVFGKLDWVKGLLAEVPESVYGISYSNERYDQKCSRCKEVLARKPDEVLYGIHNMDGEIIFSINDPSYFFKIFQHNGDGIGVDILSRDQFICGKKNVFASSSIHKGFLLQPVYLKELKANSYLDEFGNFFVKIGDVPDKLKGSEIELNMLLIQDKFLCIYNPFYDIPGSKWGLLEMGMFLDSARKSTANNEKATITNSFELKFEIPFEKNISDYNLVDIQPIYDSLNLNDYTIKTIGIRAYSSVEGTTERNIVLQEKRANSIVNALSSIQSEDIPQSIIAKENWVEFYQDILKTKYAQYAGLSHEDVKIELKRTLIAENLEPMLSQHRKAVVFLSLERKSLFKYTSESRASTLFSNALSSNDLLTAMQIQEEVFNKIKDHKAPTDLLDRLELPNKKEFGLLINNQVMFNYKLDSMRLRSSIYALLELEKLVPHSGEVKYNIIALELRSWANGDASISRNRIHQQIQALNSYGIDQQLVNRMMINYHIVYSEYLMRDRKYKEKNRVIALINMKYKELDMSNDDVLNLAQYFVSYNAYDFAIRFLMPYVTEVDVDEDLLFYYLNLTIINKKITAQSYYKTIMMNAVNINGERFCQLFNTFAKGGITFQLLDNLYLKRTYCSYCNH